MDELSEIRKVVLRMDRLRPPPRTREIDGMKFERRAEKVPQ
jgi:hypothetical protein